MWGPADWDGWLAESEPRFVNGPEHLRALAAVLLRVPDRADKRAVVFGDDAGLGVELLFGSAVRLDRAGRGAGPRAHLVLALDVPLGPARAELDAAIARAHHRLFEGGLLLCALRATARSAVLHALTLSSTDAAPLPAAIHELELQYRLRRAGFPAPRLRRFDGRRGAGGWLVALAARRAWN